MTDKLHHARVLRPLDGEVDVDPAVQLIHLPADPGDLVLEVDLVTQVFPGFLRRTQGVERRGYDWGGELLVVEDADAEAGYDQEEDGKSARPAETVAFDVCGREVSDLSLNDPRRVVVVVPGSSRSDLRSIKGPSPCLGAETNPRRDCIWGLRRGCNLVVLDKRVETLLCAILESIVGMCQQLWSCLSCRNDVEVRPSSQNPGHYALVGSQLPLDKRKSF
jgi:hypothetical protein